MIHLVAIVVGVLVVAMVAGFFYVIHSVLKHFGLATEEFVFSALLIVVVAFFAWMFGTLALELIGLL